MKPQNIPHFSGIYLALEAEAIPDYETLRAFIQHLHRLTKPTTAEEHLLLREWAMIQWRLQRLAQMELDWWVAYEKAMASGMDDGALANDNPEALLQQCSRAINAYDRLVKLEARFKKREGQLLPLIQAMLDEESSPVEKPLSPKVALGECSNQASVNCAPQAIAIHPAVHVGLSTSLTDTQVQDAILTSGVLEGGAVAPLTGV